MIHTALTTGEVAEILDISQQTVIRKFDKKNIRGFRIPGSRYRRIPLKNLVGLINTAYPYAHERLLGFLESKKSYEENNGLGLEPVGLMGRDGFTFHPEFPGKNSYTTGEAANFCMVSQQTIIRRSNDGKLDGYKVPKSNYRKIPASELARFMVANEMDIPSELIKNNPYFLSYPGDWMPGNVLVGSTEPTSIEDSVFERRIEGMNSSHEVSIRNPFEKRGLYIKTRGENCHFVLTGSKHRDIVPLGKENHLRYLDEMLRYGFELLSSEPTSIAQRTIGDARERLKRVYN